ncbi:oxidoreductase [Streptomyces sp. WAC 01325]|uniref:SDR family oxidoreductase n=1 Tax=Streptomyces TaxID=1883 RepID=UPI000F86F907|nr:SDR family oxidoreductase [Streptomyces sp. WAC 01325]RSN11906.1 oxidoreductase [Streptomyces sp. WAC 01325]
MTTSTSKIVLVTGASSGIGAATARALADAGHHIVLGARRVDRLAEVVDSIKVAGGSAEYSELDVTSLDSMKAFVSTAHERHGRIDVLVSNAGVMPLSPLIMERTDDWDRMIDVNVRGVLHGIAATLPLMKAQGSGHFINIASTLGHEVVPTTAVYSATKYAVRAISEGIRKESSDIRVSMVSPSFVESELIQGGDPGTMAWVQGLADKLALPATAVSDAIVYAVNQPDHVDVNELVIRSVLDAAA